MKLNLSFFQKTSKNAVRAVRTVSPATDQGSGHNRAKNDAVRTVMKKTDQPENITDLTGDFNGRLCDKPANDTELTELTEITAKNRESEKNKQDRVTEIIQAAVNLAEKFKADRWGADLEEIDKAFNTVMHAERNGSKSDFAYALMELEALTEEYSQVAEKAVA